MSICSLSNSLVFIDNLSDYTPFFSTLTNCVDLLAKKLFLPFLAEETIWHNRYFTHLDQKSVGRSLLLLIPGVGNFLMILYDFGTRKFNDTEAMMGKVNEDGLFLRHASKRLQNDFDVVLAAVKQNGLALRFASRLLQHNSEIVMAALRQNHLALKEAAPSLKERCDFMMGVVEIKGELLRFADPSLKNNLPLCERAVEQNGEALAYVGNELKNNEALVRKAIQHDPHNLQYAGEDIRKNMQFMQEMVEIDGTLLKYYLGEEETSNYQNLVLKAVNKNGFAMQYVADSLKGNERMAKAAFRQNPEALEHIAIELVTSQDFMLECIEQNGLAMQWIAEQIDTNIAEENTRMRVVRSFQQLIISQENLNPRIQTIQEQFDREAFMVSAAKVNCMSLQHMPEKYLNNPNVVNAAISHNGQAIQFAAVPLKNDSDIALAAFKQSPLILDILNDELVKNKNFMLSCIAHNSLAMDFITKFLNASESNAAAGMGFLGLEMSNEDFVARVEAIRAVFDSEEFMISAARVNGLSLKHMPENYRHHRNVVKAAISQNTLVIQYLGEDFENDSEMVLEAVKRDPSALKYVSENFRNNPKKMLPIIKNDFAFLIYAGEDVKRDFRILCLLHEQSPEAYKYLWNTNTFDQSKKANTGSGPSQQRSTENYRSKKGMRRKSASCYFKKT